MAYGRLPWIGDIWSPTHPGAVRGNARCPEGTHVLVIGRDFDHKVLDWVSTVTWAGNIGTIPDRIGYFVPVSFADRDAPPVRGV